MNEVGEGTVSTATAAPLRLLKSVGMAPAITTWLPTEKPCAAAVTAVIVVVWFGAVPVTVPAVSEVTAMVCKVPSALDVMLVLAALNGKLLSPLVASNVGQVPVQAVV